MPKLHSAAEDVAHAGHMIGRGWVQVIERGGAVCGFMARNEAEIHAAQRFYLRHGFRETARTDGASTDEKLPDIHYVWSRNGDIA